ncbi:MAG: radical SAM protein [Anaerolineae bacterium]|nr:radical SAM protein [Gloeobacterales cyanobacterium ES-bin-313]
MIEQVSQESRENRDEWRRARLVANNYFQLIILPTENCNFRCTYCYEDFSIGRMKRETIEGIKALLTRRHEDLSNLRVSWFGGEPLVAKDIVFEVAEHATALASRSKMKYVGTMTTNAYLLDIKTATRLCNAGVTAYQISLDGPRDVHDRSRLRADGKGTFDQIWSNLLAIRDSDLPVWISLRVHIKPETLASMDELIEQFRQEFLHDKRFSVFFKAVEHLGGPNDDDTNIFSQAEQASVTRALKTKLYGSPTGPLDFMFEDYVCYAARPNSLLIRANGDLGKCTVALYDQRNRLGRLLPDGTLEVIPGKLDPWVQGIKTLNPAQLACPLSTLPALTR